jgi:nitroreductase
MTLAVQDSHPSPPRDLIAPVPIIPAKSAASAPLLTPDELIAAQSRRYATKKFDGSRVIPADHWAALEQALLLSPSSNGFQPWRFLVIADRARREKLVAHSYGQRQVADASHLIVFQARTGVAESDVDRWVNRLGEIRGISADTLAIQRRRLIGNWIASPKPGFDGGEFSRNQVFIALGTFLSAAALLGIDTCPIGGFNPDAYDAELEITGTGYRSLVLAAAGYRSPEDQNAHAPKVRFPIDEVITFLA